MNFAAKEILEGMRIPKWYGVAYFELNRNVAVCYPVPFNWVVRWARDAWLFLKNPPPQRDLKAFMRGIRQGRELGEEYGREVGFDKGYAAARQIYQHENDAQKKALNHFMKALVDQHNMRLPNVVLATETVCRVCGERQAIAADGATGGHAKDAAPGQPAPGTKGDRLPPWRAKPSRRDATGEDVSEGLPGGP